ncbi:MAG: T9SS C-terminal target domain-containing protein [Candidatus Kapaibacterium sp.]|nr:MAG: T9SS C-terminal target domain-containing protein [Candidatus Kapabacteria bacterium]
MISEPFCTFFRAILYLLWLNKPWVLPVQYGSVFSLFQFSDAFLEATVGATENNIVKLSVYPNPAYDYITSDIPSLLTGRVIMRLVDVSGRVVLSFDAASEIRTVQIPLHGLMQGMYALEMRSATRVARGNVIKQ